MGLCLSQGATPRSRQDIRKFYTFGEILGRGSFGLVKEVVSKENHTRFAVKIINVDRMSADERKTVQDEKNIMLQISHPNVVRQIEFFETKKKLYLVMEILSGGELFDRIVEKGSFSERDSVAVVVSIAEALQYLHGRGVVHRDLKPENLLYVSAADDAAIKISDFGLANMSDPKRKSRMHTACGTPGYVAPEVLQNQPYGPEVDMWSLGVIIFILLCGFPPFYDEDTDVLYSLIKAGKYSFDPEYWSEVSSEAKDLISKLLVVDPQKRFSPTQVLNHPWITNSSTSSTPMSGHITRLRLLQAKRRLRAGVQTIIAISKFIKMFEDVMAQEEGAKSKAS